MDTANLPEPERSHNVVSNADETGEKIAVADVKFATLSSDAKDATDREHAMTLCEGIRKYPKAIAWSVLLSLAVVMEGYGKQYRTPGEPTGHLLIQNRHGTHILVLRFPALQQEIRCRV